jgi:hypothetical protein
MTTRALDFWEGIKWDQQHRKWNEVLGVAPCGGEHVYFFLFQPYLLYTYGLEYMFVLVIVDSPRQHFIDVT